jgi:hypothetical protein
VREYDGMSILPKFMIFDDPHATAKTGVIVLHTEHPRFLIEFLREGEGDLVLFDHARAAEVIAAKMAARNFFSARM